MKRILFVAACVCFLTQCARYHVKQTSVLKAYQAVPYGLTCSVRKWDGLARSLQSSGVHISLLGDYVFLIIPAGKIFQRSDSYRISNKAILNKIAEFLNCCQKIAVTVTAYNNARPSSLENKALSTQQAKAVVDYLWYQGLDVRMITPIGGGHKVGFERKCLQQVEIAFKKLP